MSGEKWLQKDRNCVISVEKKGEVSVRQRGTELQPVLKETVCICFRIHQVLNPKFSRSRGGQVELFKTEGTLAEPNTVWTIWEEDLRQS